LSATAAATLELVNDGLTVDEVAQERGLAVTTVEGHVEEAIETGALETIDGLVLPERREQIQRAIARVGDELLRPIMDELGEGFTYAEIRFVRAARRAGR
jgi:ATP-dependent DNA helicase RecQ